MALFACSDSLERQMHDLLKESVQSVCIGFIRSMTTLVQLLGKSDHAAR
ncbi:hypothetical protein GCM10020370_03880 [Paenibacillus hodogayensis]